MCELEIRDESGAVVDDGEVGEICVRGAVVFLGYWENPDASAKALDAQRWYRTGDYGRIADGILFLESRMRDMIIRGGENIYPIEIEHRLEEHPEVAEAAVVGVQRGTCSLQGAHTRDLPRCAPLQRHALRTTPRPVPSKPARH